MRTTAACEDTALPSKPSHPESGTVPIGRRCESASPMSAALEHYDGLGFALADALESILADEQNIIAG